MPGAGVLELEPLRDLVVDRLADLWRLHPCTDDPGWEDRRAAIYAVFGFLTVIFCFGGVNFLSPACSL